MTMAPPPIVVCVNAIIDSLTPFANDIKTHRFYLTLELNRTIRTLLGETFTEFLAKNGNLELHDVDQTIVGDTLRRCNINLFAIVFPVISTCINPRSIFVLESEVQTKASLVEAFHRICVQYVLDMFEVDHPRK